MSNPLTNLHRFIAESFDLEELRTLCFDLGVEHDDLGGEGRSDKARELVRRMGRRKELERLVDALRKGRPGAFDEVRLGLSGGVEGLYDALPEFEAGGGVIGPGVRCTTRPAGVPGRWRRFVWPGCGVSRPAGFGLFSGFGGSSWQVAPHGRP
jgi:hypothetical protein